MKYPLRNYLIWIPIFILTAFFLFSCATNIEPTQPEEKYVPPAAMKEEQSKPEAQSEAKPEMEPEAKPGPPAPSIQETTLAPPSLTPTEPTALPTPTQPASAPASTSQVAKQPAQRTTEIALSLVNLREGPTTKYKVIHVLKKGTKLIILEEKLGWLRVRLVEGIEGWVSKSTTLEGIHPSPAVLPKGEK